MTCNYLSLELKLKKEKTNLFLGFTFGLNSNTRLIKIEMLTIMILPML
ncbi:hypothetical protein H1P_3030003 [Hyella patelloides LEGE 07179]|uniref:Uncharacterized protein n=1 Tax=Hyella patelloides LEGE 07179 TaxID=945734 RepID=A0A563VUD7_9CYAN|nr:hypothetical protein H1P_3030003 [Hyella patelloides LEGE 07179]